jgi:hypothetical protein
MNERLLVPLAARRRSHWPHFMPAWAWLAAVGAAALLFAFGSAVKQVMAQGEERRAQTQQTASTFWRCNTLPGEKARADCRVAAR